VIIKTKDDWWALAKEVMPQLKEYMREFDIGLTNFEAAEQALNEGDAHTLHRLFEFCWGALPDSESIRFGPFFDLCDLCSEVWVFND
jgi:hypothetical protein